MEQENKPLINLTPILSLESRGWIKCMQQRTKIIATVGPASENITTLKRMMLAGMDVARLNLSHNKHEHHLKLIKNIRKAAHNLDRPIAIILDLQGPKIRTGEVYGGEINVIKGEEVILVPENQSIPVKTAHTYIPVQFADLYKYTKPKQIIYIDDAAIELKVKLVKNKTIVCSVQNHGVIKSRKGINLPGVEVKIPALGKKDKKDLEFGIKNGVDFVALSYVSNAKEILDLRKLIYKLEKKYKKEEKDYDKPEEPGKWSKISTRIIAKIERPLAVKNFDKILTATDAVMVARGDLGLEMPLEDLPLIQKDIIEKCLIAAKPVIIATQMLNSMTTNPHPTRAEVSDVANAIMDGADAVMLSGESATGLYPVKSVKVMDRIAREVELAQNEKLEKIDFTKKSSISKATAATAKKLADKIAVDLIVCTTTSGYTARALSRHKPGVPIISLSPSALTQNQLNLSWGVYPYHFKKMHSFDRCIKEIIDFLKKQKLVRPGNKVVLALGHPLGYFGATNLIKIEII